MEEKKELNYIKDCEIDLEKGDLLSTRCYADTISKIIDNSDTPFTIGLFGGWGSGKSSIIKTLDEKLRKDQKSKAEVFSYDAWKYSKDSFRRTFILELKKRFKLDPTAELETFYKDKNEEIKGKTGLIDKWWINLIFILLPLPVINLIPIIAGKEFEWTTFVISIFISAINAVVSKTFVQYKISINKPRIFAPEEFENIFSEMIDQVLNRERNVWVYIKNTLGLSKKIDKLVIVIDNIDRCHKDLAFELLLTVKNFLEKQGVIFIIPIDEDEMKRYLNKEGYDANEFLRKLFNTTLNIKKFSENDLYNFAKALNGKYGLSLPENVISLVAQEFSKNPRRIIQFLNVLQTEILFSKKQEDNGNIPAGIISNNLPFLTKVLLIREEWFDLYKSLRENPYLLEDINQSLKKGEEINFIEVDKEQLRFLERTRHIETDNIEVFFVNKDVFSGIPDELNKLVISQDWEGIKVAINKSKISFEQVMQFIDKRFNEDVVGRGLVDTTGFNIFSLIFKISNDKDFSSEFKKIYYTKSKNFGNIKSKLNCADISKIVWKFNPKDLFGFIELALDQNQILLDTIIKSFPSAVMGHKDNYDLFKEFILTFAERPQYLNRVGTKFSETIIANPNYFDDFEGIFKNDEVVNSLITSDLIREFVNSLESDRGSNNTEIKVRIIKNFEKSKIFSTDIIEGFINKIVMLLNSSNDYSSMGFWLRVLMGLISKTEKQEIHDSIFKVLSSKYSLLANAYAIQYNNEEYIDSLSRFLDMSKELYEGNKTASREVIMSWFAHFFSKNDNQKIYLYITKIYLELIRYFSVWNWPFAQQEIDKFNQLSEWEDKEKIAIILNLMVKKTEKDKGLDQAKIKSIFLNYLNVFKTQDDNKDKASEWVNLMIKNNIAKENIIETIKSFNYKEKLNIITIIKDIDDVLLKESLDEIMLSSECINLQEALIKFNYYKIGKNIIKKSVKTILDDLSKETDEMRFKCFLEFVVNNGLVDKEITSIIINKVRPLLGATNKEIIFSLNIIDKLNDIDDKKKNMIKTILDGLDDNDFDDEGKKLLIGVRKKL